ncbi:MAG TPA: ABC transporter ATP-binding protein [Clostridia bacterium]|jgi:ATP-binding cassette subfamily B protein|nr:ABC transporter ATP-binding protein [Clostridia bacterium]
MSTLQEQDFDQYSKKIDLGIWKRLLKYALRYKKVFFTLVALLLLVACVDIVLPLMSRYAIDNFVEKSTLEGIVPFVIVYLGLIALQAFNIAGFIKYAGKLEMNIAFDIRQQAFKKLQELSFSFYDKTAVGYLMARMVSDISRLSEMIAWSIVDMMWALAYVIGVMVTLMVLNYKLALIVLVVIPPLVVISIIFQRLILKYQRVVRKTNSRITGSFNEGIMGAMTSKTLVREQANTDEFVSLTGEMRRASIKATTLSAIFMPLVMFLGSIGTGLALERGGYEVMVMGLSFGTLSVFITYTMNFFEPIQQLAAILAEMQSAQASAERVITLIDTPCEITDTDEVVEKYGDSFHPKRENWEEIKGQIEFEHVSFSYKDGESVLDDFSLKVRAGETIALVGETGSGKSTIINLVCRFYEPTQGRILVDGRDYKERSQLWLQDKLGYVLQTPHLFSGTIRENICYSRKDATDEQVRAAARMVSAEEFILRLEKGYDTEVGEGGARLSTGEKQLISFARVILADPKIFVLDEATSSIDTETEQLIQNAITRVLKDRTSFIVAHRLSTIRNADRILVIKNGKIAEMGSHRQLIKQKGHYYDLYTTQFKEEASDEILR